MQMTQINRLGKILFFMGAILAIAAAAKMPNAGDQYPDTLLFFIFAFLVGIVGNIIWHSSEKKLILNQLEQQKSDESAHPIKLLEKAYKSIALLQEQFKELTPEKCMERIDAISSQDIHPFVDKRRALGDLLGQQKAAEILLEVAYGERMINRTWSAISDGHREEAQFALSESVKSFSQATKLSDKYATDLS